MRRRWATWGTAKVTNRPNLVGRVDPSMGVHTGTGISPRPEGQIDLGVSGADRQGARRLGTTPMKVVERSASGSGRMNDPSRRLRPKPPHVGQNGSPKLGRVGGS